MAALLLSCASRPDARRGQARRLSTTVADVTPRTRRQRARRDDARRCARHAWTTSPVTGDAGACPAASQVDFGGPILQPVRHHDRAAAPQRRECYAAGDGGIGRCAQLANCVADCIDLDGGVSAVEACNTDCLSMFSDAKAVYQAMQACIAKACMNDAGTAPCNGT